MLHRLEIKDPKDTCVPWFEKVPWLAKRSEVVFQPGVNIVVGPNGSGKSTLLTALARMLHCAQGNVQKVTSQSVSDFLHTNEKTRQAEVPEGLRLQHDGSPVMHTDPNWKVGLVGGLAGFDSDFFSEGVANVMFRGSFGQTTMKRLVPALEVLAGGKPVPAVQWKYQPQQEAHKQAILAVLGEVPAQPVPVLLLDEPTRGLDIDKEFTFWSKLNLWTAQHGLQVLVAAHSMFCYNVKNAHYIETCEGFCERVRTSLHNMYKDTP